jgi:hypothetical protein
MKITKKLVMNGTMISMTITATEDNLSVMSQYNNSHKIQWYYNSTSSVRTQKNVKTQEEINEFFNQAVSSVREWKEYKAGLEVLCEIYSDKETI